MRDSWSDPEFPPRGPAPRGPMGRDSGRPGGDRLEQGLDRLVSAGRQLVDGVSGARPGSRPPARGTGRGAAPLPRLNELGRWVENKLDWILEDDDDWREPWQEVGRERSGPGDPRPEPATAPPAASPAPVFRAKDGRRRLEAISRRPPAGTPAGISAAPGRPLPPEPVAAPDPVAAPPDPVAAEDPWPDPQSFSLPRWQRPAAAGPLSSPPPDAPSRPDSRGARPMPRSSRRRSP
ncbi:MULTISPECIES: hypothetical protein [Aphanothece]|uniref:hypothetical protein n=1 Tax=Aphanothece TaxID=1121 RepID=UPI003984F679